jgi:hypothetical protein
MRPHITTYILCVFFVLAACFVQSVTYLNTDSAWLIASAQRLLSGQNLYTDFVETNPPFIVYFMTIPVLAGGFDVDNYKVFTMLLVVFAGLRSFKYVKSDFVRIIMFFGLFVLSVQSFGQREHLFVALILPYFFSILADSRPKLPDVLLPR